MTDFDGGLPPLSFSPDPQLDLKSKKLPWPVYLAIGLAVLAAVSFLGLRTYQSRQNRKVHVAFMEQFSDFEKNDVNDFWRCLFGKEGDARRFNTPEQVNASLEGAYFADRQTFPDKVKNQCKGKALKAAENIKRFSPPPPPEYAAALDKYGNTLSGLANSIEAWADGAPKRFEVRQQEEKVKKAGDAWNAANPAKPEGDALQYDKFLRCAVPGLDKLKDGQALIDLLASKCLIGKGRTLDNAFLTKLKDTCIPDAQEPVAGKPTPAFRATLQKLASEYDREAQAWDTCFKKMRKEAKKDDLEGLDKTWADSVNASTEVRKIGKDLLKED